MEEKLIEKLSHSMTVFEENNPTSIERMSWWSPVHIRWIMPLSVASFKYCSIIVHTIFFFFGHTSLALRKYIERFLVLIIA